MRKRGKIKNKKFFLKKYFKRKTVVFIDYANIKAWAREKDLAFDLQVLYNILKNSGVSRILFYYGTDPQNPGSYSFLRKIRQIGFEVITKEVKYFKISLLNLLQKRVNQELLKQLGKQTRQILRKEIEELEKKNIHLLLPKANFDVEIALDMVLFKDKFNTFILFSGDSDFIPIVKYLQSKGKKVLVISGKKYLAGDLAEVVDYFFFFDELQYQIGGLLIKKPRSAKRIWKKSNYLIP